jgi:hypothetical protein
MNLKGYTKYIEIEDMQIETAFSRGAQLASTISVFQ